jgi:hypothetical protein
MSTEHSRLEMLRFLRRYVVQELARIDDWIQQEQLHADHERERRRIATRAAERPWWIQLEGNRPVRLHLGGCFFISRHDEGRACTRDQAVEALARGAEPCGGCRPDADLGVD